MIPSPERPELYGFVCLYSTLLPQAGRQLELCWRTSRDSHPSEDLSKLRTGVSLWADGIMAGQLAKAVLAWVGIALHLTWPSFDAEFLRTGGLRALGLTLAPSANVFKLPDMTAGGVFQGAKPLIYQQRSEVQSPLTLLAVENTVCTKLFCHLSIFFNFCKIRIFRLWIVIRWTPIISSSSRSERSSKNSARIRDFSSSLN